MDTVIKSKVAAMLYLFRSNPQLAWSLTAYIVGVVTMTGGVMFGSAPVVVTGMLVLIADVAVVLWRG